MTESIEPVKLNTSVDVLIPDDRRELILIDWDGFRAQAYGPSCTDQIHDKAPVRRVCM